MRLKGTSEIFFDRCSQLLVCVILIGILVIVITLV